MNSIYSWINEEEVRKLAEDLTAIPEAPKEIHTDDADGFALIDKKGQASQKKDAKEATQDRAQEMKQSKNSSLAEASAMATSAGLIGKNKPQNNEEEAVKVVEPYREAKEVTQEIESDATNSPPLCDHSLNAVPVNIAENVRVSLPNVHPDKEVGTFEQIDQQLIKSVKAKGICVIDRDGDVLYSSMINPYLVAFTIEAMMGTKLMQIQEGEFGNIRIKMSAGEYLEFVSVKSTRGVLVLAVAMDHILGKTNAQYVAGDVLKIADSV